MADTIDPKELLLNNKGLVITYVIAIIPIVLHFVVVGEMQNTATTQLSGLSQQATQLESMARRVDQGADAETPVYTKQDVTRLQTRQDLYKKEVTALAEVVRDRDVVLERWFPKFEPLIAKGQTPGLEDYVVHWDEQLKETAKRYGDMVTDPEDSSRSMLFRAEPDTAAEMPKFQKRYWIQEAVLEALQRGNAERLVREIEFPPVVEEPVEGQPYEVLRVSVQFACTLKNLPLVTREFLSREITMRITRLTVDKRGFLVAPEFNDRFRIDGSETVFNRLVEGVILTDHEQFGGQERWIPEPSVKVDVTLEVYDFSPPAEEPEDPNALDPNDPMNGGG